MTENSANLKNAGLRSLLWVVLVLSAALSLFMAFLPRYA
jgi:hypothetical protein